MTAQGPPSPPSQTFILQFIFGLDYFVSVATPVVIIIITTHIIIAAAGSRTCH